MARSVSQRTKAETPQERLAAFKKANLTFFFRPYPWQEKLIESIRTKNTTAAISSNKIGKTACVVNICISWLLGWEPWTQGYAGEDKVMVEGYSYRPSSLGIKPPVNLVFTGEDWKLHIGKTIAPELKKWLPQGWYDTKKNEQGVDFFWTMNNGSTMTMLSYTQDDALFESFRIQGAIEDEPPPMTKHTALSRGLLLDNGKTLMSLTPLKEPWILDEIVLSGRRDIGIIDGLCITDNPDLYNSDLAVLGEMGLNEEQKQAFFDLLLYENKAKGKPVTDKGYAAEKYLESLCDEKVIVQANNLKILKFIKDIPPDEVPPRVFGQFKSLVGRILKKFEEDVHVIKPFDVPTSWPVVPMIDFHLSTPQAVSYWTVNPQDIHYCVGETWEHYSAEEIADDIIRKVRTFGWNIEDAFIDPLSKGDTAYMKNRAGEDIKSTYTILEELLAAEGITLHVASKDKDSGIKNIETRLVGPNKMPTAYLFDTCVRHLYEIRRWVYDDDGKPAKENDHFMENWYRFTLTGTKFEQNKIAPLPPRRAAAAGAWMGA